MHGVTLQSPIPSPATPGMDISRSTFSSSTSLMDREVMTARRRAVDSVRRATGRPPHAAEASEGDARDVRAGRRSRFTDLIVVGASAPLVDVVRVSAIIGGGGQESAV